MKKFLSVFLTICLIFVGAFFVGCGTISNVLTGGPELSDTVLGNGGLVVQKGDFVYFASGFVEQNKFGKNFSNINGTVENGGLYRAKFEEVVIEEDINEGEATEETTNGEETTPITETKLTNPELMVSKVVGFNGGGLYIFKDKIYFSSPSIVKDANGARYDLTTFFYCDLNGANLKVFYQTNSWDKDDSTFTMTMINEKVYLLISNKTEILKIDENKRVSVLASDITSSALPIRENILFSEDNPTTNEQFIYYTKDTETDGPIKLGQTLYKVDILNEKETELFKDSDNKIQIKLSEIKAGRLFYTRTSKYSDGVFYHYSNSLDGQNFLNSELQHSYSSYTDFTPLSGTEGSLSFLFINSNKLYLKSADEFTKLDSSASAILGVYDDYVYYISSSKIYRKDFSVSESKKEAVSGGLTPLETFFDCGMDFFYFLAKDSDAESGYSMYTIALKGIADNLSEPEKII